MLSVVWNSKRSAAGPSKRVITKRHKRREISLRT
jgi:hypothetical protein